MTGRMEDADYMLNDITQDVTRGIVGYSHRTGRYFYNKTKMFASRQKVREITQKISLSDALKLGKLLARFSA